MRLGLVVGGVLFLGCGPNFTGDWRGDLSTVGACSDGSGGTRVITVFWAIVEHPSQATATITPEGGTCGSFLGDTEGNKLTVRRQSCPVAAGIRNNIQSGGTLTLTPNDTLSVLLRGDLDLTNGGTCHSNAEGTLTRVR